MKSVLKKDTLKKEALLGNEAVVKAALLAGVDFVCGYPGCPAAEVGDIFGKIAKDNGIYFEWSTNEKTALEAAVGASFSGLKSLITMKNFGLNVCSEVLLPLCYTGAKAPMVIFVGDDPSCWSSAQSEQNSRGYSLMAHLPTLEPSDAQECYDFTKLAFEISEKFKIPVMVRTTIRVAHQRAPVEFEEAERKQIKTGSFVRNARQYVTLPPRVLEMKKELLEKIEKIRAYFEKSKINTVWGKLASQKVGIIASGVGFAHLMEAQKEMGTALPVLKIGSFYPLPEKIVSNFIKKFKKALIVEELEPYIEKEVERLARSANPKVQIFGKDSGFVANAKRSAAGVLSEVGELNPDMIASALAKMIGKKYTPLKAKDLKIPRRVPKLCDGCPYWYVFPILKKIAPPNTVFGGDIGCNMIAGYPPHNMQDFEFCMGSSIGITHGVKKAVGEKQKVIALMGDGTFFHSGIAGMINAVYNNSNPLFIIVDNRTTAMTGHQNNPGMGKNGMEESSPELKIEDIAKACGIKNIKVLNQINPKELEDTVKDFLNKKEISVIICKRICALIERRLNNNG